MKTILIYKGRNFFNAALPLILLVGISSCSKEWLDHKTSQSLAVPATLNDFQLLMNNTYTFNLYRSYTQEVTADGHFISDAIFQGGGGNLFNIYTWSQTYPYLNVDDWIKNYFAIVTCNIALEGLAKIHPDNSADQRQWNDLRGEALFFRALSFFELSQIFAPTYDSVTAAKDMGIPIRLSSDVNLPSTRASVQQTYDQITGDLIAARSLLPLIPSYKSHPSSPAVDALLARVFLSMEKYTNAKQAADSCLAHYNSLMDYNNDPDINISNTYPFTRFNKEVIFHGAMLVSDGVFLMDTAFYHLYGPGDLRKGLFYTFNPDSTIDFIGSYDGDGQFFSGLATDEIYLIRAECEARAGDASSAMIDLNNLLTNRFIAGTPPIMAPTADSALSLILTERKKELITRAQRWSDLRRLNRDPRFAITLQRTVLGVGYTLPPNDYRYTFPIPDDIIQYSHIPQNPGWTK